MTRPPHNTLRVLREQLDARQRQLLDYIRRAENKRDARDFAWAFSELTRVGILLDDPGATLLDVEPEARS
jgi:hypothetical protein